MQNAVNFQKENLIAGKASRPTTRAGSRTVFGERGTNTNGATLGLQQTHQAHALPQAAPAPLLHAPLEQSVEMHDSVTANTRDPSIEDIDIYDHEDPAFCTEYVEEIFACMKEKELEDPITNYMVQQVEITEKHRMILIDWMAEVTVKFRLLVETMFLAVNILDRFLQRKAVARPKLQLVGITSMLIASKYEEIMTPEINDFIWITAKAYTHDEVIKMERLILVTLNFDLAIPTPLHFLRRYSKAARSDSRIHTLSKYITEISMVDYKLTVYRPSMIAASAVYIARRMTVLGEDPWNRQLEYYTGFSETEIMPCCRDLNAFLIQQPASRYQATYRKYAQDKLLAVARIPTKEI